MSITLQAPASAARTHEAWSLRDGTPLTLRPLQPHDAAALGAMLAALSPASSRRRFHGAVKPTSPSWLARMTQLNPLREWAVVLVDDHGAEEQIVAEGRLCLCAERGRAEFALVVAEGWQGRGIGRRVVRALIDAAAQRGLQRLHGDVLAENLPMLALMQSLGFTAMPEDDGWRFERDLAPLAVVAATPSAAAPRGALAVLRRLLGRFRAGSPAAV
jgi:acetyltransferase